MAKSMTEGARKVLATLQGNQGKEFLTAELAELAGVSSGVVTGTVTGLSKKGYAMKRAATIEVNGKEKEVKYISITDEGMNFDPDAVPAE